MSSSGVFSIDIILISNKTPDLSGTHDEEEEEEERRKKKEEERRITKSKISSLIFSASELGSKTLGTFLTIV